MRYINNFSPLVTVTNANIAVTNDTFVVSTATQTVFNLTERPRTAASILVTKNGLALVPTQQYTIDVTNRTLVLSNDAKQGDLVEVRYLSGTQGPRGEPGQISANTDQQIFTSNTVNSTSTSTGALIISGGAGISKDVYVGGNLTVLGNVSNIGTQNLRIEDSLIELHATDNFSALTVDDGRDIGLRMHYYKGAAKSAFFGWSNTTGYLEYYSDGTESAQGKFTGNLGTAKFGSVIADNLTANNLSITSITTNAASFSGNVSFGNLTVTGTLTLQQVSEILNTKTGAAGTVVHDFSTGIIFYHSAIAGNFTVNLTNVPTTNNRAITLTLVLSQGATPYMVSALQINGTAQTIAWAGGAVPTGTSNKINVIAFTIMRSSSAWTVLGQSTSFG